MLFSTINSDCLYAMPSKTGFSIYEWVVLIIKGNNLIKWSFSWPMKFHSLSLSSGDVCISLANHGKNNILKIKISFKTSIKRNSLRGQSSIFEVPSQRKKKFQTIKIKCSLITYPLKASVQPHLSPLIIYIAGFLKHTTHTHTEQEQSHRLFWDLRVSQEQAAPSSCFYSFDVILCFSSF